MFCFKEEAFRDSGIDGKERQLGLRKFMNNPQQDIYLKYKIIRVGMILFSKKWLAL